MYNSQIIACIFLILFTFVATVDGLYFHLYKYKLYARKDSIKEHHLHTLNALFFPVTVVLLFVINSSGPLLWILLFFIIATLVVEFLDVFEERASRESLGGLTSLEYSMHFAMSGIRTAFSSLILVHKPAWMWSLRSPWILEMPQGALFLKIVGLSVAVLGIPVFILHYYLGRSCEKY
jgi:hypothetical protein